MPHCVKIARFSARTRSKPTLNYVDLFCWLLFAAHNNKLLWMPCAFTRLWFLLKLWCYEGNFRVFTRVFLRTTTAKHPPLFSTFFRYSFLSATHNDKNLAYWCHGFRRGLTWPNVERLRISTRVVPCLPKVKEHLSFSTFNVACFPRFTRTNSLECQARISAFYDGWGYEIWKDYAFPRAFCRAYPKWNSARIYVELSFCLLSAVHNNIHLWVSCG